MIGDDVTVVCAPIRSNFIFEYHETSVFINHM